jgi:periplasmic protein TonB
MARAIPFDRCTTFGISCLLHVALVGGAIVLGRDLVTPRVPAVLIADLTLTDALRLEEPKVGPPAPPPQEPTKLTPPKPTATPMPAPAAAPQTVESRIPIAPATATEPSPPPSEPASGSAPLTSLEAAGETPAVQVEPSPGGANPGAPTPSHSAAVRPAGEMTRTAMPRGGYQVRPSYPTSARRLGIQGMTTLRVYVAADGRVGEVLIHESAGHPDLDSAAADAVKRWRFEPARRGTEAVGVWVLLPVEFRLR